MLKFFVLAFVLLVVSAAPASKTVTNKVKQTGSLENELPGQPTELSGSEEDDDEEEEEIDVKAILGQFFRKLKKHPEVIQELIEKEEERLMGRVGLEEGGNHNLNSHETSRELPHEYVYQNSKTVVKKDGQAIVSDQQYDPRSAAAPSSTSGSSNYHDNTIPHQDNNENIQEDREKIEEFKEKFNKANPIINALPLFHHLPNVQPVTDDNQKEFTDNSADDDSKSLSDENTETQPDEAADAKSDDDSTSDENHDTDIKDDTADSVYDIKEIKHVPIEEELASEVPPSELAAKAELREEAHDALQTAAKEALKTKKYQESLQKEAEEKAKQEEEDAKKKQEANEKSRMDPYKYLYYYYDYGNDDSESKDSGLSSSIEQSYPSDSEESESLESSDESTESTDSRSSESEEDDASPEEDEDDDVNDEEESSEEDISSEENDSQEDDLKQLLGKNKVSNKLHSM